MRIWRWLRAGWGAIFGRARVESELDAELRFHVEAHAEDLMRDGALARGSVRQARLKLGGLERTKEECRDALGVSLLESLIQDVRFGLRMLRKNPDSRRSLSSLLLWASARIPRYSVSSMPCCCGRCRTRTRTASCGLPNAFLSIMTPPSSSAPISLVGRKGTTYSGRLVRLEAPQGRT